MLSFMTELPVDNRHGSPDFLRTIQTWILGSPHSGFKEDELSKIFTAGEARIQKANEAIESLLVAAENEDRAGIRYTRHDKGLEWVTSVVFSWTPSASWVGIRVSCESSHPAVHLPPAKKPVLVQTLLNELGGVSDGALFVGNSSVRLEDVDVDLAARLIRGQAGCRLPIVYVSAGFQRDYIVDPDRLAADLAGMAHVVVEPNRPFSLRLKLEVASENVYGGTIGIYWPDGGGRRSFFIGREHESPGEVARAIFQEVRTALTNRRGLDICTWASLQEAASRHALQALRASGSQEIGKYIETFDKELAAKAQRLEAAEREISRQHAELRAYEMRLAANPGALLRIGREEDLYPGEVFGIMRDALEDGATRVLADSRRQHVLASVLDAKPKDEDFAASMKKQLKDLLRGSRSVDSKIRRGLEAMGFTITEEGKHYKLVFQDDDRYTFALAKSGSDHRGGLNAASDIGRLLF